LYTKLFLEFKVWGREYIPEGPKIFCANHFSSTDPFFMITLMKEPVHMVIGPGFKVPVLKTVLRLGEQINALPEVRQEVIPESVGFLKEGESVFIFPEGVLTDPTTLGRFYHGLARIYLGFPCPVIPIGIISPKRYIKEKEAGITVGETIHQTLTVMSGKYYANIGEPMYFEKEEKMKDTVKAVESITGSVRERINYLINDIKINKFWA
jgi:1-acyl-sn-glycerol-3-phosphate acyltransferase